MVDVLQCFQGICHLGELEPVPSLPLGARPDFWAQVWPWMEFIDTYRDHIPGIEIFTERVLYYSVFFWVIKILGRHEITAKLIDKTPGFYVLITRMWSTLLEEPCVRRLWWKKFGAISAHLTQALRIPDDGKFEQTLEGAGGSRAALASLAVKHIDSARELPLDDDDPELLVDFILALGSRSSLDAPFEVAPGCP
ncbi:hypothetical protein FB451DRAFT_1290641 [Mycena latifolia]|nr:hypothetical protein FB451DRAFT_1290641 [Mycena latifolia]